MSSLTYNNEVECQKQRINKELGRLKESINPNFYNQFHRNNMKYGLEGPMARKKLNQDDSLTNRSYDKSNSRQVGKLLTAVQTSKRYGKDSNVSMKANQDQTSEQKDKVNMHKYPNFPIRSTTTCESVDSQSRQIRNKEMSKIIKSDISDRSIAKRQNLSGKQSTLENLNNNSYDVSTNSIMDESKGLNIEEKRKLLKSLLTNSKDKYRNSQSPLVQNNNPLSSMDQENKYHPEQGSTCASSNQSRNQNNKSNQGLNKSFDQNNYTSNPEIKEKIFSNTQNEAFSNSFRLKDPYKNSTSEKQKSHRKRMLKNNKSYDDEPSRYENFLRLKYLNRMKNSYNLNDKYNSDNRHSDVNSIYKKLQHKISDFINNSDHVDNKETNKIYSYVNKFNDDYDDFKRYEVPYESKIDKFEANKVNNNDKKRLLGALKISDLKPSRQQRQLQMKYGNNLNDTKTLFPDMNKTDFVHPQKQLDQGTNNLNQEENAQNFLNNDDSDKSLLSEDSIGSLSELEKFIDVQI